MHTLDLTAGHDYDHTDHMIVGAITTLALARTNADPDLIAYRGYNIASEPIDKSGALFDEALHVLSFYEACASGCAPCGQACSTIDKAHVNWLGRRYALGIRRGVHGKLRTTAGCLAGNALVPCDQAPEWTLTRGQLKSAGGCLEIVATGALAVAPCAPGSGAALARRRRGPSVGRRATADCTEPQPRAPVMRHADGRRQRHHDDV